MLKQNCKFGLEQTGSTVLPNTLQKHTVNVRLNKKMATIDQYKHKLLGFIECPSDYDIVYDNPTRNIAVYQLEQDIPIDEIDFDGCIGDLIVGGGSGEVESLRISTKGIEFFTNEEFDDFDHRDELVKSFWSPTFAFKLGNGLTKLNWTTDENMEFWFAERVVNQFIKNKRA
jgi:hypothetical protein